MVFGIPPRDWDMVVLQLICTSSPTVHGPLSLDLSWKWQRQAFPSRIEAANRRSPVWRLTHLHHDL